MHSRVYTLEQIRLLWWHAELDK